MLRAIFGIFAITIGCCISVAAAPTAAACPAGTYQASSGDCVEAPDSSPSNVTAICADGTDSHSEHRSGTCSRPGGVAQSCPCGSASAPAAAALPQASSGDTFMALAVSPNSGQATWATHAPSQQLAEQAALDNCAAVIDGVCKVIAEVRDGCAALV